ncbi:MAG: PAS domain S-box protein, partial [Dehalococcoidia bacterium]
RALRESEQHLALAQQAAHIGSWERPRSTGRGRWSDEQFRMLGYEVGEVEPSFEAYLARVHPDDRERIASAGDGSWDSDEPLELEARLLLPDGSERVVQSVSRVIRDSGGKPLKKLGVHIDVTDRATAERALLASEQRFQVVLDTMQAAVLVSGPDMRPLIANRALVEMLGYSEQELLALGRDMEIAHPDDREALARMAVSVRSGAMPSARLQCRLTRKDGSVVNVEGSITPFMLDSERKGLIFEAADVTARLIAERELRESREQLARAQEVAHLGSWNWNLETDDVWWSDQMYRLHGWEPGEVPATFESMAELMSDEDAVRLRATLVAIARDGEPFDGMTMPIARVDGTRLVVRHQVNVTRERRGTPIMVVGTAQDVTQLTDIDEALRESEEHFGVIFETAADGIAVLDGAGDAIMVNNAICEMLGYRREELMGFSLAVVIAEEDREAVFERLAARAAGEDVTPRSLVQLVRKDGTRIDTDISASPYEQHGKRLGSLLVVRDITEELALQRQAADAAAEIATILDTAPDPIIRIDSRGVILRANAAVSAVFGWDPDELMGCNVDVLVDGVERPEHADYIALYAETGEASPHRGLGVGYRREAVGRRRDGVEFPIEISVAEVQMPEGEPQEFTSVLRDVSERFAAQRALEESEERFRAAFEAAQNGMLLLSHEGETLLENGALREMLGFHSLAAREFAEERGRPPELGDCLSEEDLKRLDDVVPEPAGASYTRQRIRVSLRSLNGTMVEAEMTASEFSQGGRAVGSLVEVRDITDQVAAERSLHESEEHLQAVVDTVQSGLVIRDRNEQVLWFNQAVCDLFGCTPEEFRSLPLSELIISDDLPAMRDIFSRTAGGEHDGITGSTFRGRRRDGRKIAVRVNATPFTQDGEIVGVLSELHDVTEEVQLREQLLQSQKLEAMGTLVAGVSHDFNNLLTAIVGALDLARQEDGASPWIERASVATDRAGQLVQQLLQFAREGDAKRGTIDLEALGAECIDLLGQTIDRRIELSLQGLDEPLLVWGDRGQLQQVLLNLLMNSRDAVIERLEHGEIDGYAPEIRLRFNVATTDDGDWAEMVVQDNGIGMTPEVSERVFDPFFTTKEVDAGTGLGLSTAYGIISDHGGSMVVDSTLGSGATFVVRLPLSDASAPAEEENGSAPAPVAVGSGSGQRVLVVDDEQAVIEVTHQVLARGGYEVTSAMGGKSALEMVASESFDLVLLDVNMPTPNGWQTLQELLQEDPRQRVLMVSGYALEEEARELGALGLLQKPFDARMLMDAVGGALAQR